MRTYLALLLAAGCTHSAPLPIDPEMDDPRDAMFVPLNPELAPDIGPITPGRPLPVDDFEMHDLPRNAHAPVAGVRSDGTIFYAYIDDAARPMVMEADGEPRALPAEEGTSSTAIAIAASQDGAVHLVWDVRIEGERSGAILYARLRVDGTFSEVVLLDAERSREPTLAIAQEGDIVVAWTREPMSDSGQPARVMMSRGIATPVEGLVFSEPQNVAGTCCMEDGFPANRVSGPTLALDSTGRAHIVYEWSAFATRVEYVHETVDGFTDPKLITEAAFVPCPSLNIDDDGVAHVTYLLEFEQGVFMRSIDDGIVSDEKLLYRSESSTPSMALTMIEHGLTHVVVAEGGALRYLRIDAETTDVLTVYDDESAASLSPRAGGFLITPAGRPLIPFNLEEGARVATGR